MTIEEIILEKVNRLESVPNSFLSSVQKMEAQNLRTILKYVGQLERDGDVIKKSAENLRLSTEIITELKKAIIGKDYLRAVTSFAKEFDVQAELSDDYFSKEMANFKVSKFADASLQRAKTNTVLQLVDSTPKTKFIQPLQGVLDVAISSGQSWTETVQTLTDYAIGNGKTDGKLLFYSKQIAHDSFAVSDRNYTNIIADEYGMDWFKYFGGLVTDSREFCTVRHGKFYHRKEIESWGNMGEWDGKMPGTNETTIFVFAGGFNCRHSILPVSVFSVPDKVIRKSISEGYYKPTAKEKELLKL